jgi:methylated-DNA-protein-cysteine methyltransferase-like protein
LVPGWADQAELLHNEGVFLKDTGHVDLKKYQWEC